MPTIDVSIIIPVFNRADLAREAIASAVESAGKSVTFEILVIDDGSDADEATKLREACTEFPECHYFRLKCNSGPQLARNFGLQEARGYFIKFLDSDDLLLPGALAEECTAIKERGTDLLVSGWLRTAQGESDPERATVGKPQPYGGNPYDAILARFGAPISAVLYTRNAIGPVNWDEKIRHPDDWLFLIKVLLRKPTVAIRESPVFVWRDHGGSRQSGTSQIEYAYSRFEILNYLHQAMLEKDEMTPARRQSLADYFYRDIYIAHRFDPQHYQRILDRLDDLVRGFQPSSHVEDHVVMRLFGSVLGYRRY